jgi:hypothetical protein
MLAVDAGPLLGDDGGGQPQPETEKVAGDGMQVEGAMGLGAVQEDGDAGDGDMGQGQGDEHVTPPGKLDQAIDVDRTFGILFKTT